MGLRELLNGEGLEVDEVTLWGVGGGNITDVQEGWRQLLGVGEVADGYGNGGGALVVNAPKGGDASCSAFGWIGAAKHEGAGGDGLDLLCEGRWRFYPLAPRAGVFVELVGVSGPDLRVRNLPNLNNGRVCDQVHRVGGDNHFWNGRRRKNRAFCLNPGSGFKVNFTLSTDGRFVGGVGA